MASVVVDLCTPPSSPQHASRGGGDDDREEGPVIDLCTPPPSPQHASGGGSGDDEAALDTRIAALKARVACLQDDEQKRKENKRKETQDQDAPPVKVQRPAVEPSSSADTGSSPMDDDEVLETAAPPALNKVVQIGGEDDEDEVQCTGRSGDNALMDFPHARENCCVVKFVQGQEHKFCQNCYCYVCDGPAAKCPEWANNHCKASHLVAAWQQRRGQWKARQAAAATSGDIPRVEIKRWSCDEFYKALLQVYPKEEPQPTGLLPSITLRPYQKQSLAFMIDLERSTQPETAGSVEGRTVRGGWLCDEMGMGKTAVATALCLANPLAAPEGKAAVAGGDSSSSTSTLKLTLVIVNNTLVKQWEDEVKRFAPSLRVHSLYLGAGEGRSAALHNLKQVDVLITTPHAKWPAEVSGDSGMHIHRLIVDESHLLSNKSWKGLTYKFLRIRANHVWCVTGTPFSAGLPDLDYQARLLGHWTSGAYLSPKINGGSKSPGSTLPNEQLVAVLRTLMIRHVKAQRIGGEVALALPDASSETVWLQMSPDEKLLYTLHACYDGKPPWSRQTTLSRKEPHKLDELERGLTRRRDATCHAYSARAIAANGDVENNCDPTRTAACAAFLRMHTKGTPVITVTKGTDHPNP